MIGAKEKMCVKKYHVLLLFSMLLNYCNGLSCRSEGGGPKEGELKTIYRNCLKKQEGKNSSSSRGYSDDEWRDSKGHSQKSPWDRDGKFGREDRSRDDRNKDNGMRDDTYGDERGANYDRMGSNFDRNGNNNERSSSYDRMGSSYDNMGSSSSRFDRMGSNHDRIGSNYDKRDDRMTRSDGIGRSDIMASRNEGYGRSQISGRDDFSQNSDFGEESTYRSSTQASRRYKREKRISTNSGRRSQYNPNTSNKPSYDDYRNEDRNSSGNSSKIKDHTACAMHCFLENMEMTGDNGMPDRYLVTHAITKDVKNEDLRDFLQESIEECFQILDNENTEDKCEFSKNLLMCLSEKGRANCDDWRDDIQF